MRSVHIVSINTRLVGASPVVRLIDVNYVNVNAFYFYFTPILAEIDVKTSFTHCRVPIPKRVAFLLVRRYASVDLEIPVISTAPAHGCTYGYTRKFPLNSKL